MSPARVTRAPRHRAGWLLRSVGAAASCAALLAGCASVSPPVATGTAAAQPAVAVPSLGLFSRIKVPGDRVAALALSAQGVQIFRCEKRDSEFIWVFRQPDAQLLDAEGKVVGRHGANFSFEHVDGSRLVSTITAYDEAPNAADLRWLLLSTRSFGAGSLAGITHVQRINTKGGMPPPKCDAARSNQLLRVDFSADFVFYRATAGSSG
jgi:hypothetical protein